MKTLFQQADIDQLALTDYIASFADVPSLGHEPIQLPPLQRNAVWNVGQVERLWDSVLRGFPIGSFYLAERSADAPSRSLSTGIQQASGEKGYFLLDGQQRTRALLLGFQPTSAARLYIDLNPQFPFDNAEANDRRFLFRLLTNYQPWGMNGENPTRKLSDAEKYKGRSRLNKADLHYDYQLTINNVKDWEHYLPAALEAPWPLQANLPVPFDILLNACGGTSGTFRLPDWDWLMQFVPSVYADRCTEMPTEHFQDILDGIRQTIDQNYPRPRHISLLLHHSSEVPADGRLEPLEILFTRVNAGGMPLEGEEMAYSLIKSSWDEAYTLVSQIIEDPGIGYLFSPTKLVMAASRLAACRAGLGDEPKANVPKFRRWIADSAAQPKGSFLEALQRLMQPGEAGRSRYTRLLAAFCGLVLYREGDDPGLPRKLLLAVKPVFLHPVLIWIDRQLEFPERITASRLSIIRYLLFCLIGYPEPDKVSRLAVALVKEPSCSSFPDLQLYAQCLEKGLTKAVPPPERLIADPDEPNTGQFRSWEALFGPGEDPCHNFRKDFWFNRDLLLWFQRAWLPVWFPGYNPMSDDAADTPYDWDHILPYSHIIGQGSRSNHLFDATDAMKENFLRRRNWYLSSLGNFRIWPSWANRSDGDKCPDRKLRGNQLDLSEDKVASQLTFGCTADFAAASLIKPELLNDWLESRGTPANWPLSRRTHWQSAVERRIMALYQELYKTLEFGQYTAHYFSN